MHVRRARRPRSNGGQTGRRRRGGVGDLERSEWTRVHSQAATDGFAHQQTCGWSIHLMLIACMSFRSIFDPKGLLDNPSDSGRKT